MQDEIKAALTEVEKSYSSTIEEMRVIASYGHIPHFKLIILLSADMQLTADGDKKLRELLSKDEQAILAVCEAENDQADISSLSSDILNNPEIANLMLIKSLVVSKWILSVSILKIITNFDYQDRSGNSILNALAMTNDIDDDKIEEEIERFITLLESKDKSQVESLINKNSLSEETVLHRAVRSENAVVIKWLITRGIDVSKRNLQEITALDLAVVNNKPEIVLAILEAYSEIGILNEATATYRKQDISENGNIVIKEVSIMQWAVICHAFALSSYLLEQGLTIDIVDKQNVILLHHAARYAGVDAVRYLVSKGLNINAVDDFGKTALHYAAESGSVDMIDYLVEQGLDINTIDIQNKSVIHYAAESGSLNLVRYLVSKGLNINAVDDFDKTALHYAAESGSLNLVRYLVDNKDFDIDAKDERYQTALHYAAESGSLDLVKYLIEKGADIKAYDIRNRKVLYYAARSRNLDLFQYFVEKIWLDINVFIKHDECIQVLYCAVERGDICLVKYLVDQGLGVNYNFNGSYIEEDMICQGATPLHVAVLNKDINLIQYLIEKRADVNNADINEQTVLHLAVINDYIDIIKYLIEKGVDVNSYDVCTFTALHYAALNSSLEVVQYLIEGGADINLVDISNKTALHFAVEFGRTDIVKYLIDKDVNVNAVDIENKTALDLARDHGKSELIEILLTHNAKKDPEPKESPPNSAVNDTGFARRVTRKRDPQVRDMTQNDR
jgi:ankyrin repeat protein